MKVRMIREVCKLGRKIDQSQYMASLLAKSVKVRGAKVGLESVANDLKELSTDLESILDDLEAEGEKDVTNSR